MVAQRERFFSFVSLKAAESFFVGKDSVEFFSYECNIISGKFMLKHSSILSEGCLYHYAEQDAQ